MQLSKEITNEYLGRFMLFKNPQEIADMIGVTRASVHRWITGEGTPRSDFLPALNVAFDSLLDWIDGQGFKEVSEALDFDRPVLKGQPRMKSSRVEGWLVERLKVKKSQKRTYEKISEDATKVGITRGQLYRASVQLGVHKDLKGFGINRESVWSLPNDN